MIDITIPFRLPWESSFRVRYVVDDSNRHERFIHGTRVSPNDPELLREQALKVRAAIEEADLAIENSRHVVVGGMVLPKIGTVPIPDWYREAQEERARFAAGHRRRMRAHARINGWLSRRWLRRHAFTVAAWVGGILAAAYWSGHLWLGWDWLAWNLGVLQLERNLEMLWRKW